MRKYNGIEGIKRLVIRNGNKKWPPQSKMAANQWPPINGRRNPKWQPINPLSPRTFFSNKPSKSKGHFFFFFSNKPSKSKGQFSSWPSKFHRVNFSNRPSKSKRHFCRINFQIPRSIFQVNPLNSRVNCVTVIWKRHRLYPHLFYSVCSP